MRIPRAFLPGVAPFSSLEVSGETYHHLARVLRRRAGDPLVVLDSKGGVFQARVETLDSARGVMTVRVGESLEAPASPGAPVVVALGVPRGDGLEVAIRLGSEMGLLGLIPLLTARGVVRMPRGRDEERKLERWRKIARESAGQCRRPSPLAIDPPATLSDLLTRAGGHPSPWPSRWIAVPGGADLASSGLPEALSGGKDPAKCRPVLVVVGPEGGFEPEEVTRAQEAGFHPVGFPTPVLRTPTTVAYLAALSSLVGWLRSN